MSLKPIYSIYSLTLVCTFSVIYHPTHQHLSLSIPDTPPTAVLINASYFVALQCISWGRLSRPKRSVHWFLCHENCSSIPWSWFRDVAMSFYNIILNTIHIFSQGTQKGSLCTYSALCSITCCMNPQLGNITCICTGLGLTHTQEHTAQREVCVWTPKGSKWRGQSPFSNYSQKYTPNVCDEKVLQWLTSKIECPNGCVLAECLHRVHQEGITTTEW